MASAAGGARTRRGCVHCVVWCEGGVGEPERKGVGVGVGGSGRRRKLTLRMRSRLARVWLAWRDDWGRDRQRRRWYDGSVGGGGGGDVREEERLRHEVSRPGRGEEGLRPAGWCTRKDPATRAGPEGAVEWPSGWKSGTRGDWRGSGVFRGVLDLQRGLPILPACAETRDVAGLPSASAWRGKATRSRWQDPAPRFVLPCPRSHQSRVSRLVLVRHRLSGVRSTEYSTSVCAVEPCHAVVMPLAA